VFENDSSWLSNLIFGTSKNEKMSTLDNKEHAEAEECTCSSEVDELTKLLCGFIVMMLKGTSCSQFPFKLISPALSVDPAPQNNICITVI
jgi:hypothetical protein